MSSFFRRGLIEPGDAWFIALKPGIRLPDFWRTELLYRGIHSQIFSHTNTPDVVSKLVQPRSMPRDALRRYVNCQGKREFRSTRMIAALGLCAPDVLGYGIAISPFDQHDSLLFMRPLVNVQSLKQLLRTRPVGTRSDELLHRAATEMGIIYRNGLHLNDSHYGNILVDESGGLIWIDNDIRCSTRLKKQEQRLCKALIQMRDSSQKYLDDFEWQCFKDALKVSLSGSAQGAQLANHVIDQNA